MNALSRHLFALALAALFAASAGAAPIVSVGNITVTSAPTGATGSVLLTLTVPANETVDLAAFQATVTASSSAFQFTAAAYPSTGYVFPAADSAGISGMPPFDLNANPLPDSFVTVNDFHLTNSTILSPGVYNLAVLSFLAPANLGSTPVTYTLALSDIQLVDSTIGLIVPVAVNGSVTVNPAAAVPEPPALAVFGSLAVVVFGIARRSVPRPAGGTVTPIAG
jgi:hypothetical protein